MNNWVKRTLVEAICRDCGGSNLKSIEDRFPMREWDNFDGTHQKASPRECLDCGEKFDVVTRDDFVIGWSGKDLEFLDTPPIYMTPKKAWDMGIRHGIKNPYE